MQDKPLGKADIKAVIGPTEGHYLLVIHSLRNLKTSNNLKILEVGAGPKTIEKFLPKNFVYHTMDNAESFWKEKYTYDYNVDKGEFPIKDGTYDVVICNETLEHVMYPERVIKEIMRVAKKDALFFFSMPNEYNFLSRIYFVIGKKTKVEEPFQVVEKGLHIHRPRVKDILNLFSRYFKIRKIDYSWQSRSSDNSGLARMVDKIIMILVPVWPSLFARTVSVKCTRKSDIVKNIIN